MAPPTPPNDEERSFLRNYRSDAYPRPAVAVDLVVFTVKDSDLKVLLIRRGEHPFKGCWALPGGFVRVSDDGESQGEDLDETARRELEEETGLGPEQVFLEQLYTFGKAGRDPRMRVITVAYYALVPPDLIPRVRGGTDAQEARWWSLAEELGELDLAFDHRQILGTSLERLRGKLDYAPIAFELVPATFTIAELRAVHEAIKGEAHDRGNFRRRFRRMLSDGLIERAPGKRQTASKPAAVYRFVRR